MAKVVTSQSPRRKLGPEDLSTECAVSTALIGTGRAVRPAEVLRVDLTAPDRRRIGSATDGGLRAILWDVCTDTRTPHSDSVEMSGRRVSLIVRYGVDADRRLILAREAVWPSHRLKRDDVRGYLRRVWTLGDDPTVLANGGVWRAGPVSRVEFDGVLSIVHEPTDGVQLRRTLWPSPEAPRICEQWQLANVSEAAVELSVSLEPSVVRTPGILGEYVTDLASASGWRGGPRTVAPGAFVTMGLVMSVGVGGAPGECPPPAADLTARRRMARAAATGLRLETPDDLLNTAFSYANLRATESIFNTQMGLVHSPGGGRYYGGVWANDQVEYSGPFFAMAGDADCARAALTAYRIFAGAMEENYSAIPSSFEVEGDVAYRGAGDRGDAAMYACGASRFLLAYGDAAVARELWPAIAWCLEYCRRRTNAAGVVESDTDELEGRFTTGTANLSTSALAYGGYLGAMRLARALGRPAEAEEYGARGEALRAAIEAHFGHDIEGYRTYRYHEGSQSLRSWVCLPLVMQILERAEGTLNALFSPRLWTADGLATEAGDRVFWDRSTLYALRGAFAVGDTLRALERLSAYTRRRLLGEHVPYPVEAWPEGDQAHLSAESALYCRVFTEGLFGMEPTGLRSCRLTPRLPGGWDRMALRGVRAFGALFDLDVRRSGDSVSVIVPLRPGGRAMVRPAGNGAFDLTFP